MPVKVWASLATLVVVSLGAGGPASGSVIPAGASTSPTIHGRTPFTKMADGVVTSPNWSGYAVTGETFTDVVGSWVQPTATCPAKKQQDAAFWVGIDGYSRSDDAVEQIGTDSDCNKGKPDVPHYYAWWEMDTATSTHSNTIPETVSPGDHMTAEVSGSDGVYTPTLTDVGKWSYSPGPQTQSPAPPASSAEWIAEAPSICKKKCVPVPLSDFGSVTFTGATANGASIASFPKKQIDEIEMRKGKTIEGVPTALSGSGFTIDWDNS
jgi:hypothetical protein